MHEIHGAAVGQEELRARFDDFHMYDTNGDHVLDYSEFCAMVRDREGELTEAELLARFEAVDADGQGTVDLLEYIRFMPLRLHV